MELSDSEYILWLSISSFQILFHGIFLVSFFACTCYQMKWVVFKALQRNPKNVKRNNSKGSFSIDYLLNSWRKLMYNFHLALSYGLMDLPLVIALNSTITLFMRVCFYISQLLYLLEQNKPACNSSALSKTGKFGYAYGHTALALLLCCVFLKLDELQHEAKRRTLNLGLGEGRRVGSNITTNIHSKHNKSCFKLFLIYAPKILIIGIIFVISTASYFGNSTDSDITIVFLFTTVCSMMLFSKYGIQLHRQLQNSQKFMETIDHSDDIIDNNIVDLRSVLSRLYSICKEMISCLVILSIFGGAFLIIQTNESVIDVNSAAETDSNSHVSTFMLLITFGINLSFLYVTYCCMKFVWPTLRDAFEADYTILHPPSLAVTLRRESSSTDTAGVGAKTAYLTGGTTEGSFKHTILGPAVTGSNSHSFKRGFRYNEIRLKKVLGQAQ